MNEYKTAVALVDDHILLRKGLASLIRSFGPYMILFEARDGKDLINKINPRFPPDIVLLDVNMPGMDGYSTALWLKRNYPDVKVLAVSMFDNENSIVRMLKNGAKGYVLKDAEPSELNMALDSLAQKGFYYSEKVTGKLIHMINNLNEPEQRLRNLVTLNEREIEFLKRACTEMTYKEIAEKMCLSPRTIDGYRDLLFEKLKVRTRVGLVLYAIKNGVVSF
ncbi:MAG: response regulator transcription factor [Puia sp.]|nr:response regulator transcription factor [Puia sp.]